MAGFVSTPSLSPAASFQLAKAGVDPKTVAAAKAKVAAQDFEAVFINSMVNQMFTAIGGEGPFGGGAGAGVWRSFLSEEYSKSFAKAGGIGIAGQVYQTLLAQQEAQVRP
ncbi:MAG TPA: flagellar assembly peptidoglycan hydrolase FlgJ [Xanthobacteraceae bacterium]|nr:flagellar assembly peptidoglycan hydrolase FlgJ [Xanthobacteraceae bacterium]